MSDTRVEIVTWLKTQPKWIQGAAVKILKREAIDAEQIKVYADILLNKKEIIDNINFDFFINSSESLDKVQINSIGNIKGIDNLNPRNPITFDKELNVIYGMNGTGKSGYTRILKSICGSLGTNSVRSNIYNNKPDNPSVSIDYTINEKIYSFQWEPSHGSIEQLKNIAIFDTEVSNIYIDKSNETSYMPFELAIFEQIINTIQSVKTILEQQQLTVKSNLPKIKPDLINTKVISYLNKITAKSDKEKLTSYFTISKNEIIEKEDLENVLKNSPDNLIKQLKTEKNQLEQIKDSLNTAYNKLNHKLSDTLKLASDEYINNKKAFEESSSALKNKSLLSGVGTATWLKMWNAAVNFSSVELKNESTLGDNDNCVLCHQTLSIEAKDRLKGFEKYVSSQLKNDMNDSETKLKAIKNTLPKIPTIQQITTEINAAKLDNSEWLKPLTEFWETATISRNSALTYPETTFTPIEVEFISMEPLINKISHIEQRIKSLDILKDEFNKNDIQCKLLELSAKEWTTGYIVQISAEIQVKEMLDKFKNALKTLGTAGITKKSGELSKKIITDDYINKFNSELINLGANNISVELVKSPGNKGKIKHQLKLKTTQRVSPLNVLSEGEQRIVGIAACLADIARIPHKTTLIFDDPISSLDQYWEENTAKRLIELSEERQVIVLTHRVSLLGALMSKGNPKVINIRKESWGCGDHGNIPLFAKKPISALRQIRDERIPQAKKILDTSGSEFYEILAKSICSDIRILVERVVEVEFLGGIIQRHSREVQTKNKLEKLIKINSQDCDVINKAMTTFSTYEHSQPTDSPIMTPTPDFLIEEINKILDWNSLFIARKVSNAEYTKA